MRLVVPPQLQARAWGARMCKSAGFDSRRARGAQPERVALGELRGLAIGDEAVAQLRHRLRERKEGCGRTDGCGAGPQAELLPF